MAIFFNHIKGCGVGSTGVESDNKDLWSWIKWADAAIDNPDDSVNTYERIVNKECCFLPKIYLNTTNNFPMDDGAYHNGYCLGRIITSDAREQEIVEDFSFDEKVFTPKIVVFKKGGSHQSNSMTIWREDNGVLKFSTKTKELQPLEFSAKKYDFNSGNITVEKQLSVGDKATFCNHVEIQQGLFVGSSYVQQDEGVIKAQNKCEALYFNATSDRRAKSNITPVEFSALDTIKQLPVYTFNYLNDSKLSIGLIAQEAAEHDLDGFNMVDNLDASGEFGDFMQMKESKLVYVLWKAVQELSAEVEELKAEIRNLK